MRGLVLALVLASGCVRVQVVVNPPTPVETVEVEEPSEERRPLRWWTVAAVVTGGVVAAIVRLSHQSEEN